MDAKDYKSYIISTIDDYSNKSCKALREMFWDKGIAQKSSQMELENYAAVDISGYELKEQIRKCILENERSLEVFEIWEFKKDYKYSVLFEVDDFEKNLHIISEKAKLYEKDHCELCKTIKQAVRLDEGDNLCLVKFLLKYEAIHPTRGEELLVRYPIVIAFHKKERIVEMRFDSLKRYFMERENSFYADLVYRVCIFLEKEWEICVRPLDLDFLVKKVQKDSSEVKLVAQTMEMASGGYAQLEVGKNEENVLPFIGELKNFLSEYSGDFEKVPTLKEKFEQFIFEKEEASEYPWIELMWEDEIKTRSIHVKFSFNYSNAGYCLLQHYSNTTLTGMERMNRVVQFIDTARSDS